MSKLMPMEISHRRGSISLCECELERPQVLMALDCDGGEPGRNRTFNPQIKSPLRRPKTGQIPMISSARSAKECIARRLDATPAQPRKESTCQEARDL